MSSYDIPDNSSNTNLSPSHSVHFPYNNADKEHVVRAIKWLWEVDALNIKYSISNSPKSSLETIYCAWFNVSVLSVEEKIDLAKWAIANYDNAWDVIYSELLNGRSSICSNINHPHYRDVDEVEDLYESDVNKTYIEYITACLSKMDAYPNKWKKIIESMNYYYDELFGEVAEKLFTHCSNILFTNYLISL